MAQSKELLDTLGLCAIRYDGLHVQLVELLGYVGVCESGGIQALVEDQGVPILVDVDDGGGIVGKPEVQPGPYALPGYLSYLPREDGRLVDSPLPEAVDPPIVRVRILEALNLCDGGLVKVGVVLVCGPKEGRVLPGDDLLVDPVVFVGGVEVDDGPAGGSE